MDFYFAPLEGVTTYTYRNLFHKYFQGVDKYFMPFVAPGSNKGLKKREIRDILPENNTGLPVVPQVLTNSAENYLKTEKILRDFGYQEININMGCPVGTVVAKGKGAGMLQDTWRLEKFLDEIFEKTESKISIKTRIGMEETAEFDELLEIYQKYPLYELIIHPRLRMDYYKNQPHMESYEKAMKKAQMPICYNGDICMLEDYKKLKEQYSETNRVMIGRGLIANPFLLEEIKEIGSPDRIRLKNFLQELAEAYIIEMGETNALFKMKEIWFYFSGNFEEGEKIWKKIRKCNRMNEYRKIMEQVLTPTLRHSLKCD